MCLAFVVSALIPHLVPSFLSKSRMRILYNLIRSLKVPDGSTYYLYLTRKSSRKKHCAQIETLLQYLNHLIPAHTLDLFCITS